jgi:predicted RNase H-like HicB family nuclease
MADTVGNLWQKALTAIRRAFHAFEKSRADGRSEWELTVHSEFDAVDGAWIAWVEELPGCVSEGESEKDALDHLTDAIAAVIELKVDEALARSIDEHPTDHRTTSRHLKIA